VLTVLLSYEYVHPNMKAQLPVNSMRNHALLLAQTPLVALLDADLMASASMAQGEHCHPNPFINLCSRCSCISPYVSEHQLLSRQVCDTHTQHRCYGVCASCGM
jgi:hypothetical protein